MPPHSAPKTTWHRAYLSAWRVQALPHGGAYLSAWRVQALPHGGAYLSAWRAQALPHGGAHPPHTAAHTPLIAVPSAATHRPAFRPRRCPRLVPLGSRTIPADPRWDHAATPPEHLYRTPAPVLSWAALPPKLPCPRHGPEEP
ncbi:hypothetical protein GCM10010255_63340 [Streptomyces coeruleofuscus]|uniref:Uncharacterized protein n=1 Tax=Streptomyces coeruleofuscus TaxID=66879 RepID=A0ABP5W3K8_9ACTN